jgi:hypothetical protein
MMPADLQRLHKELLTFERIEAVTARGGWSKEATARKRKGLDLTHSEVMPSCRAGLQVEGGGASVRRERSKQS